MTPVPSQFHPITDAFLKYTTCLTEGMLRDYPSMRWLTMPKGNQWVLHDTSKGSTYGTLWGTSFTAHDMRRENLSLTDMMTVVETKFLVGLIADFPTPVPRNRA